MRRTISAKEEVKNRYNALENFDNTDKDYFRRRAEKLSEFMKRVKKSSRILNLGCGDGEFSNLLNSQGYSNIVDIDISVQLLKHSKCANRILGDAEHLPFKADAFDSALLLDVIEHIEKRDAAISELSRVLKVKSRVFITYPSPLWVPVFNFLGRIGVKTDSKDNVIFPRRFKSEFSRFFEVNEFNAIMLAAKLPPSMISASERLEHALPNWLMNSLGFVHIYSIRKR